MYMSVLPLTRECVKVSRAILTPLVVYLSDVSHSVVDTEQYLHYRVLLLCICCSFSRQGSYCVVLLTGLVLSTNPGRSSRGSLPVSPPGGWVKGMVLTLTCPLMLMILSIFSVLAGYSCMFFGDVFVYILCPFQSWYLFYF